MAIDERFFRYLDHVRPDRTVAELARGAEMPGTALRHDVDHDLELALEMAYWEHEQGVRASYYLLHSAPYWESPSFADSCRQLAAFGHEVGLHGNVMAQWARGQTDDPRASLHAALDRLRGTGVTVTGTAAHGDRDCYEHDVINYWCFTELRGDDPHRTEDGLSAEGVVQPGNRFRVSYPLDHVARRADGAVLPLWSVPMADLGLDYEAVKVPTDSYYSDSGGSWVRSPDPLGARFDGGRHQILLHPEYWRGPQRLYVFLSTARAGSTWLAKVLDEASSVTARHEMALNHRYVDGSFVPDKRTGAGFVQLLLQPDEARRLMLDARSWMEDVPGDVAEANVYLAHFPALLADVFPDATLVHLFREPRRVVPSILARDWYDTPDDDRHAPVDVPGWDAMSQLEKACWYVRRTNEQLLELTGSRLLLEQVTADPAALGRALRPLGIAFYPELAHSFPEVVNAGRASTDDAHAAMPAPERRRLDAILSPLRRRLGYERPTVVSRLRGLARAALDARSRPVSAPAPAVRTVLVDASPVSTLDGLTVHGFGDPSLRDGELRLMPDGARHAHVLLGASTWQRASAGSGWPAEVGGFFRLELDAHADAGTVRVFCLMYDATGAQVDKRLLGPLAAAGPTRFAFRTRANAERFDIALYASVTELPTSLTLTSFRLEREAPAAALAGPV